LAKFVFTSPTDKPQHQHLFKELSMVSESSGLNRRQILMQAGVADDTGNSVWRVSAARN